MKQYKYFIHPISIIIFTCCLLGCSSRAKISGTYYEKVNNQEADTVIKLDRFGFYESKYSFVGLEFEHDKKEIINNKGTWHVQGGNVVLNSFVQPNNWSLINIVSTKKNPVKKGITIKINTTDTLYRSLGIAYITSIIDSKNNRYPISNPVSQTITIPYKVKWIRLVGSPLVGSYPLIPIQNNLNFIELDVLSPKDSCAAFPNTSYFYNYKLKVKKNRLSVGSFTYLKNQ